MKVNFPHNGADNGYLQITRIVVIGNIPVAGFLSERDCQTFLEALPKYTLADSKVYFTNVVSDCYTECVSSEQFLADRES